MKHLLATTALLSCLAPNNAPAIAANTSVENALAGQSDLSMFYQALENTGVANELNENKEYSIFAPTNAAFAEIQPHLYPCFYAAQCQAKVAAILRNHIVPRNESVKRLALWGNGIQTVGDRRINVEEPYKDQFSADGHRVIYQNRGSNISVYQIDGVITDDQELAQFRQMPVAYNAADTLTERTIITYRKPAAYSVISASRLVPGGHAIEAGPHSETVTGTTETTTTVTHTKIAP